MYRHVVLFRWTAEATKEDERAVADELGKLPGLIEELRAYRFGANVGSAAGNYDFAVVADFDDEAAFARYRDHEAHQAVLASHIRPIVAERAAVQYEIDDT